MKNDFIECLETAEIIMMEGALAERLKREHGAVIDSDVALASFVYDDVFKLALKDLFLEYIEIAKLMSLPIMITTPTRRANKERVGLSRYDDSIIKENIDFLKTIKESTDVNVYIGGLMGCKGDAYSSSSMLDEDEAYEFHSWTAKLFKKSKVDYLFAGIMPEIKETLGMARAMSDTGLPYIISFMIRKDGRLLDGTSINDAIELIDNYTENKPVFYMTNCVHPDILHEALAMDFNRTDLVRDRFKGIQANTAYLDPEELDGSRELISSDPDDLALSMKRLRNDYSLKVFGGCCGTNGHYMTRILEEVRD